MKPQQVPGIAGYAEAGQRFVDATLALTFRELHQDFIPFFPKQPAYILDIGAGIGRDAAAFARMGYTVIAVEPLITFRDTGMNMYPASGVEWIDDALPALHMLKGRESRFDFILVSGVWHHLRPEEQLAAAQRTAALLKPGGILALSLRNGPAGVGRHIFPTNGRQTIVTAGIYGLSPLLWLEHQPSLMPGKEAVYWTKLVLQKQGNKKSTKPEHSIKERI